MQWKPVPEFTELEVSSTGAVRYRGRLLPQHDNGTGYQYVRFGKHRHYVHRLVLIAFRGPSSGVAHHRNHVRYDNRLDNLEWTTQSQNLKAARDAGRLPTARAIIGQSIDGGDRIKFISINDAARYGFTYQNIWKCLVGKRHTADGYIWSYAENS